MTPNQPTRIIRLSAPPGDLDDRTLAVLRARWEAAYAKSPDRFPDPPHVLEVYRPPKRLARKVGEQLLLGLVCGLTEAIVIVGGATLLAHLL